MSQSDFVSRGQALVAAGQFQEAVKVCRLGLLGRPTTVEGRIVLGQALLALKRFDEVLAEMRVALELDHTSVAAQVLKGDALLRKGDAVAAIETLHRARADAPGDPRILQLLGEAEHPGRSSSAIHAAVGFVSGGDTKHYPNHPTGGGEEDSGPDSYTKPTSLAAPGSMRRSSPRHVAVPQPTPGPAVLEVGDRSGTVEVDPELEGVELDDEIDFDDLAAPPVANRPGKVGGARGAVKSSRPQKSMKTPTVSLEVDDEDVEELAETRLPAERRRLPGPGTNVRNAVAMPSGPIDAPTGPPARAKPSSAAPPLARAPAAPPQALPASPLLPTPSPLPPAPRAPLAAAQPTMAAAPMPQNPYGSAASLAAAARPTIAIAAPSPPAGASGGLFGHDGTPPAWAKATVAVNPNPADARSLAAALEPTARPAEIDPAIAGDSGAAGALDRPQPSVKTGMRKTRSRLGVVLWIVIGIVVIGGGVVAGFQIRALRLRKQIAAAHERATDLAKADTWAGWAAARDSLAGIVQAAGTLENRAALARARALIAFEFGDGLGAAKPVVAELAGHGGLDGDLAAAYLALAQSDAKAARLAADAALSAKPDDAAALYVVGQANVLSGDVKAGVTSLRAAFDHEARPLYGVGLARALAAASSWDDALATIDRVLAGNPGQPAAVIARGAVLVASGRITASVTAGNELRAALQKLVAEGRRPIADQPHGVSPAQVGYGDLVLAEVDFAHGDVSAARADINAALGVGIEDDQRFAEQAVDTLIAVGMLQPARAAAETALATWPSSRRARIGLARIALAQGKPSEALDVLAKQPDLVAVPLAQTVRAEARFATDDLSGARGDFDAALKKLPNLEPAIVGWAWLELAAGNGDQVKQALEARYKENASSAALTTVYAAALRQSGDAGARETARALLEKIALGPPGLEVSRAQLELARIQRDLGNFHDARNAYAVASSTGNYEARLESALLLIDDHEPTGGREALELLLKEQGDHPPPNLVLETARARMLVGDHVAAAQLLELADKLPGVAQWKLARERGRLRLRKGDYAGAAIELGRALETSGDDVETLLLAADAASADDKSGLADKVRTLAPVRLKGRPEASIVDGKLLITADKLPEADHAYRAAKAALKAEKASSRRLAQADFGLAVTAYDRHNDPEALIELELVINEDPSIYDAYLFRADIQKDKKQAFEDAVKATTINPDYARGWLALGKLATKLGDRKSRAAAIAKLRAIAPDGDELKELRP